MRNIRIIFALLLVLLTANCCQDRMSVDQPELSIYVRIPQLVQVKSEIGGVLAEENSKEAKVSNLNIWVFLSEDIDASRKSGYCLGFLAPNQGNDPVTSFENHYYMKFKSGDDSAVYKFISDNNRAPLVDVYVIANTSSSSINSITLNASTTRDQLDGYTLKGNYYGITSAGAANHTAVPNNGLPLAAVGKGLQMQGKFPVMRVETVTMKRLVSKFRFVVCQLADAAGPVVNFTIEELALNSGLIANEEYVFNNTANSYKIKKTGSDATDYIAYDLQYSTPAAADIARNTDPEHYVYKSGMTGQEYENLVFEGISKGNLSDLGKCYLRESDKPLSGRIRYTIDGVESTVNFQMADGDIFSRNHSWIVYIYFLRDEMKFNVIWTPWKAEDGKDSFHLSDN